MKLTNKEISELVSIIRDITRQEINKIDLEYSYFGIIKNTYSDNSYDVEIPSTGLIYPKLYNKSTTSLSYGDAVIVHAKNDNLGNAYIAIKNGYTPVPSGGGGGGGETYILPVATVAALGGIKSGGGISVSNDGTVSIVNNSHTHTIGNVTNLQSELNSIKLKLLPNGGVSGQVLAKSSNNDYETMWVDNNGSVADNVVYFDDSSLSVNSTGIISEDSKKLGGQSPSYYARQSDITNGTWTPILTSDGVSGNHTYNTQNGIYSKSGNMVSIQGYMIVSLKDIAMTGNTVRVGGLPYPISSFCSFSVGYCSGLQNPLPSTPVYGIDMYGNGNTIDLNYHSNNCTTLQVKPDMIPNNFKIIFSGTYTTI